MVEGTLFLETFRLTWTCAGTSAVMAGPASSHAKQFSVLDLSSSTMKHPWRKACAISVDFEERMHISFCRYKLYPSVWPHLYDWSVPLPRVQFLPTSERRECSSPTPRRVRFGAVRAGVRGPRGLVARVGLSSAASNSKFSGESAQGNTDCP